MTEHRGPGNQPAAAIDRQQNQPVVIVADGAVAAVRIAEEDHIAFLDRAGIGAQEAVDEAAELADHHLAGAVCDQRKGIALFADARRHRGADQSGVHLDPGVAQGIFHDVEGDRIDLDLVERSFVGFNNLCGHIRLLPPG